MRVKITTTILLVFFFQINFGQLKNVEGEIGFHCSVGGSPTEAVKKIQILLMKKKFNRVVKLMDSNDNAEKFMASLVSLQIYQDGIISLSKEQAKKAEDILNSNVKIALCSGCTYYETPSMKELFTRRNDTTFFFNFEFKNWLEYSLKN